MKDQGKSWLQLYVDAMTGTDPYRRLALVRELKRMPREQESDEFLDKVIDDRKLTRRKTHSRKVRKLKTAPRRRNSFRGVRP
jgi:hypothetical protein